MKSHGKNETGGHRPNKKVGEAATRALNQMKASKKHIFADVLSC